MNELGLNIPLLIAQVINFFIVLLALRLFLYRPVLNMLDRRAQRVREGLEAAGGQARREGEALLERARNEIQLERDQAIAQLRREFAELTVSAAEKVIGQSLDRQAHPPLIDEVLAESTFRER